MARPTRFRRLAQAAAALLLLSTAACAKAADPAVRSAPTRPAAEIKWNAVQLYGADYVDLHEVASRLGLTAELLAAKKLSLAGAEGRTAVFEANERDCFIDGARVFLADTVVEHRRHLWVGRQDVIKTIAPLLRPRDQTLRLPPPPRLIVIDPGHGGTDPGKQNTTHNIDEKDMTLDVAFRLQALLESRGYRVLLTRSTDTRFSNSPA